MIRLPWATKPLPSGALSCLSMPSSTLLVSMAGLMEGQDKQDRLMSCSCKEKLPKRRLKKNVTFLLLPFCFFFFPPFLPVSQSPTHMANSNTSPLGGVDEKDTMRLRNVSQYLLYSTSPQWSTQQRCSSWSSGGRRLASRKGSMSTRRFAFRSTTPSHFWVAQGLICLFSPIAYSSA